MYHDLVDQANPQAMFRWDIQSDLLIGKDITRNYVSKTTLDVPVGEDGDILMFTSALLYDNTHWIPEGMNFHVQAYQTGVWR